MLFYYLFFLPGVLSGALVTIEGDVVEQNALVDGSLVLLQKENRVRVCVNGDLCVADSVHMRVEPGCEWLTDTCRCYHWTLDHYELGDEGRTEVHWSRNKPNCVLVSVEGRGTYPVKLVFGMSSYEGRLPSGIMEYAVRGYAQHTLQAVEPKSGREFLQMIQNRVCDRDAKSPVELATSCSKRFSFEIQRVV